MRKMILQQQFFDLLSQFHNKQPSTVSTSPTPKVERTKVTYLGNTKLEKKMNEIKFPLLGDTGIA